MRWPECYRCAVSLRTKLLVLFGLLAVAPLAALGVFDYLRAEDSVRRLLRTQTSAVAERIAHGADERLALVRGNLELFANNGDTRRLVSTGKSREQAERFLGDALAAARMPGVSLIFRDSSRREVLRVGAPAIDSGRSAAIEALVREPPSRSMTLGIVDEAGRQIGTMTAAVRTDQLFPRAALDEHVGVDGYSIAVDRRTGAIVADPAGPAGGERGLVPIAASRAGADDDRETVDYAEHDSAWVGSIAPVGDDGLAVLSAASLSEFSSPLAAWRGMNLLLALIVAAAVAIAFLILARRVARPLESLTLAADEIGRGNFRPALPAVSRGDEVGRLTAAFDRMSAHVQEMMQQIESSRHMAAVGAFASQISHEIRNPLTSIKLNLQSIQRGSAARNASPAERRALEICMSEIQRLDSVVRGALQLAQSQRRAPGAVSVHAALDAALALTGKQLDAQGVSVERDWAAARDVVVGDADELRGVLLNLLLNAADALPDGGRVRVTTAQRDGAEPAIRIAVEDSGPGVPDELHESIFEPFITTKRAGSGLGLALAARDVEKHLGRLSLNDARSELGGASFVIELPLARDGDAP